MNAYPIKMTYHVRSYYFGERLIPDLLGERVAPDGVVAETWEISDYKDTTGRVTNGEYAGKTLHDLVTGFPEELVREGWSGPHFPLLEKVLDASHMLPVHLHPDDETAQKKHGEPHGKTEAWHILWAAEEATILAGIKEGLTREELFEAFKVQDYDAVMPRHPVRAGWDHPHRPPRMLPHPLERGGPGADRILGRNREARMGRVLRTAGGHRRGTGNSGG